MNQDIPLAVAAYISSALMLILGLCAQFSTKP